MNLSNTRFIFVTALLSVTIAARKSVSTQTATIQLVAPSWQIVLRKFLFNILSSSRYRDDDLYGKLLDAPFYGDPSSVRANEENAILSRGNVYKMADGQWILCQEGCVKCEPCDRPRNDPTVKWTLRRRVKALTSLGLPKSELRLTVVPQMDEGFHISKHPLRYEHVNVVNRDEAGAKIVREFVPSTAQREFDFGNAVDPNSQSPNRIKRYSNSNWPNSDETRDSRGGSMANDGYRSKRRSPSTYHESDRDVNGMKNSLKEFRGRANTRLIVGIDHRGKKHLVHLVPIDSLLDDLDRPNEYHIDYRSSKRSGSGARIGRTIRQDGPSYENLIEGIVDSFDSHRNFIEKFLFPDKLESPNQNGAELSSYSNYGDRNDEAFKERNFDGYREDDFRRVNRHPSDAGYQVEEQNEQFRRYPDMAQEVNKPLGEYQDQNTMIEYEPYGMSGEGQKQKQHHHRQDDEESLPLADVERKRHNFFGKLMDSTAGHQTSSQNHNRTDPSNIESTIESDYLENLSKQGLADFSPKINETDGQKFPDRSVSSNV